MTQDTNNQEWWMEEFDKTFKKGGYEIHRDEYGHGKMRAKRKTYQFNTRDVKAFIRMRLLKEITPAITCKELGKMFGVSASTANYAANGTNWSHL